MSKIAADPFDEIIRRLDEVSETRGGEYTARCPAHDDKRPSLSITRGDQQPVVFNCHAGCTSDEIISALGLEWGDVCEGSLDEEQKQFENAPWKYGEHVETYPYQDAEGNELYNVKRYEHPEHGWKSFRPYLPGNKRAGLGKQRRVLYRLPVIKPHAKQGGVVFIPEGEKDVHTLEDKGFHATTSGSSDSWKDRFAKHLSSGKVVVIPDNDESGRAFAEDVAKSCFPTADWVKVLHLDDVPKGGDVTDWFARGHTKDELAQLVKDTGEWHPETAAHTNGQAEQHADDLGPWEAIRTLYESGDKAEARLKAARLAVDERSFATHRSTGALYNFDEDEKVMQKGADSALGELLLEELGQHHSRHEHKEIRAKVKALTYQDEIGGGEFIPVANGDLFLDGEGVRLEDVNPKRAPLHRSEASWDPDAECAHWRKHLQKTVGSEPERKTFQEFAGYALLRWQLPFHKALFSVGPTAGGKSTTLDVVRHLYGKVASVSPQQLVNGRFGPAELEGAWANVRSDISSALLRDIGLFKEITAGDPIHVERKYEQGYTIKPNTKHFYSANRLPDVAVDDDAFYRRILIVSFPDTIPKEQRKPRYEEALLEEIDGILRWAIEGLIRLGKQGGFTHDLSPENTRRQWESHATSIGRFKANCLDVTGDRTDDIEPKDRVFNAYSQFCEENGLEKESQRKLTRTLKEDSRISDADRTPQGYSSQTSCYTGILLIES